ncbi:hypothetical protein A2U01_0043702, partial [Trifolium medium]|nr:hypothetical protein [Trifolium medium]
MDVARLLIRTSGQRVVDEFLDVKIDEDIFHIRVIEDSYGPMRIMVPQPNRQEGRDNVSDSSDEEDGSFPVVEEEVELEREEAEEEENLLAIIPHVNANNVSNSVTFFEVEGSNFREDRVEESTNYGVENNLNLSQSNSSNSAGSGGIEKGFKA